MRVLAIVSASELALSRSLWPQPTDEEVFSGVMSQVLRALVQQGTDVAGITKGGANRVFMLLEMNRHLKVGMRQILRQAIPQKPSKYVPVLFVV